MCSVCIERNDQIQVLLTNARRGCMEAFGQLADALRPVLRRAARRILFAEVRRVIDESDVANDALLNAFQRFQQFRGGTFCDLRAWLEKIVCNQARTENTFWTREKRDARRDRPIAPGSTNEVPLAADEPKSSQMSRVQRARLAIEQLPERQRRALKMQIFEEASISEIAERLDCSLGAVGGLLKRAKEGAAEYASQFSGGGHEQSQ